MAKERAVREVVALDPREGLSERVAARPGNQLWILVEAARRALPDAPGASRPRAHRRVGAGEPTVIGRDHVASLLGRDRREVRLPGVGKDEARPFLIKPRDILPPDEDTDA